MIKRLDINCVHTTADEKLRKYIEKKIGGLDKYLSRHARESAHAEVRLKESRTKDGNGAACEVTLHLPHDVINVSVATVNMYSAVDIVEVKLKQQIIKHKQLHEGGSLRHKLAVRFRRRQEVVIAEPVSEAS